MSEDSPILDYAAAPVPAPAKLTLTETTHGFALAFPLPARWLRISLLVVNLIFLAIVVAGFGHVTLQLLALMIPLGGLPEMWKVLTVFGFNILAYSLAGCYLLIVEWKWGHVPTVLTLEGNRIAQTGHRFWGIYRREWDVTQVKEVRLKIERNLFGSKIVGDLWIHFHDRWPLRLRLRSEDPDLPGRVEALLKQAAVPPA